MNRYFSVFAAGSALLVGSLLPLTTAAARFPLHPTGVVMGSPADIYKTAGYVANAAASHKLKARSLNGGIPYATFYYCPTPVVDECTWAVIVYGNPATPPQSYLCASSTYVGAC